MKVFMAGATRMGFLKSQALITELSKLSAKPLASLAKVLAERGAITARSAQLRSWMWRTGSPRHFHELHSSSSAKISSTLLLRSASSGRKCLLC